MRKTTCILLCLLLLMLAMPMNACASSDMRVITQLQTYDSRVRLRDRPEGRELGRYYAGTAVEVLDDGVEWAHVQIGDQIGYMMKEFLQPATSSNALQRSAPEAEFVSRDPVLHLADGREMHLFRDFEGGEFHILGTKDDKTLLASFNSPDSHIYYGEIDSTAVAWPGTRTVYHQNEKAAVNLRAKPQKDAAVVCKLYPGTTVYELFDNSVAEDGWLKILCGNQVGYMMEEFLCPDAMGVADYRPAPAELRKDSAEIKDATVDVQTIYSDNPIWILGEGAAKNHPDCYYCKVITPYDNSTPQICGFIKKSAFKESYQGALSTIATVRVATALLEDSWDNTQTMVPALDKDNQPITLVPGTKMTLLGSYPATYVGYVWDPPEYLRVSLTDQDGVQREGYVAVPDVTFDLRFILPNHFANG